MTNRLARPLSNLPMNLSPILALALAATATTAPLHADVSPAAFAADLIAKNQDALVEIQATLSVKPEVLEGPPGIADMLNQQPAEEQPSEANGVIIHASGLIVAPLAPLDPGAVAGGGIELDTPLGKLKLSMTTTVSALKIVMPDGLEHPAEIILRDPAAGFALLKLTTPPAAGLPAVTLTRDLPTPLPFSPLYDLVRLSADFGRSPAIRTLRFVQATPPPGPLYDLTGPLSTIGSAVFDATGQFRGLTVMPLRNQGGGLSLDSLDGSQACLLPTAEILRLAAKALP